MSTETEDFRRDIQSITFKQLAAERTEQILAATFATTRCGMRVEQRLSSGWSSLKIGESPE
jgi:hypothetical protein